MNLSSLCRWLPVGVDLRLLCAAAFCCFAVWGFLELADDAPEGDFLELETELLRSWGQPDALREPVGPQWVDDAAAEITAWALCCRAIAYWLQKRGNLKDEQQPREPRA